MNLRKNLIDIFNVIGNDDQLLRLLYYPTDPLNSSKAEVKTLTDYKNIKKTRIIRAPKSDDLTNENICRICMYMGNRYNGNNHKFAAQDVHLDVFAHIDTFDVNDARALWICDRINDLLSNQIITDGWNMKSEKFAILGNTPQGYIGYRLVYSYESEKF